MLALRYFGFRAFGACRQIIRSRASDSPAPRISNQPRKYSSISNSIKSSPDQKMERIDTAAVGKSGRCYTVERVLQEARTRFHRPVYLAKHGDERFVLKVVRRSDFDYFEDLYRRLEPCPYVRLLHDTVHDPPTFVFKYLREDLLSLVDRDMPITVTKRILKDALRGIAALHAKDIIHTDIKANNIMVDYEYGRDGELVVKQVQLTDIEDGAHMPPGTAIYGKQVGNIMWRSPEAHARGPIQLSSDMFSFAIICIYAVHKILVFAVNPKTLAEGEDPVHVVLQRQMSYFGNPESLDELLKQLEDDSPWRQVFQDLRSRFGKDKGNPRSPVALWHDVDPDLRDLLGGLTHFNPDKRLTAKEALEHRWFADV